MTALLLKWLRRFGNGGAIDNALALAAERRAEVDAVAALAGRVRVAAPRSAA